MDRIELSASLATCRLDHQGGRGRAQVELPPAWAQGRSTFGGVQAGLLLEAMGQLVDAAQSTAQPAQPSGPPPGPAPARRARSLQIAFAGPVMGPAEIHAKILRAGRSATIVEAQILSEGVAQTSALACFAADRPSALAVPGPVKPPLTPAEELSSLPEVPGITPAFLRAFELRWASGGLPGSGSSEAEFRGWVRMRESVAAPGPAWIAALVDAWPAPALQMLKGWAPASSLAWTLDFVDHDPEATTDAWWAFASQTDAAAGGWARTRAQMWSPSGRLVALASQTVAVFG